MELIMFTKMLKNIGGLTVDQAADCIADIGLAGADLTVRQGGHVLPEEVEKVLPQAAETFRSKGLSVPMITTNIVDAKRDHAEDVFRTASECGVRFIKLGYWRYEGFGRITEQVKKIRKSSLKGISKLAEEYGVTAGVHIHSGEYVNASPAVLRMLLHRYDRTHICAYIDPGHMAVEGGLSGWKMGMDLLQDYIGMVAVKSFAWSYEMDEKTGQKRWKVHTVPLSEGLVPWTEVFRYLHQISFDGPVSFHSEYDRFNFAQLIRQTKADVEHIRTILKESQVVQLPRKG